MHRLLSLAIAAILAVNGVALVALSGVELGGRAAPVGGGVVAAAATAPAVAPVAAADPAAAAPAAAPAAQVAPAPAAVPVEQVFVVGDSLTVGVAPWLPRAAAARGRRVVGINARVSRPVDEGLAILQTRAASLPQTVVVALGTNNLSASRAEVDRWLRTARQLVGDRRLIWVNLRVDDTKAPHLARYRDINAALAAAAPRYAIEIADWDRWAAEHGVPNGRDGVHYAEEAYRLRAAFYAAAIAPNGA